MRCQPRSADDVPGLAADAIGLGTWRQKPLGAGDALLCQMAHTGRPALEPAADWQVVPSVGLDLGKLPLGWLSSLKKTLHTHGLVSQQHPPGWCLMWTVSASVLLVVWWEACCSLREHESISPEHFQCRPSEQMHLWTWLVGAEGGAECWVTSPPRPPSALIHLMQVFLSTYCVPDTVQRPLGIAVKEPDRTLPSPVVLELAMGFSTCQEGRAMCEHLHCGRVLYRASVSSPVTCSHLPHLLVQELVAHPAKWSSL